MRVAACFTFCVSLILGSQALAQTSPFVGHWEGSEENCSIKGDIALDIVQSPEGYLTPTMKAGGVGTLSDGHIAGDTLTMNWSNFISHVTFTGKFVSLAKIEGTYHESITGEDCTWSAINTSAPSQAYASIMAPSTQAASPPSPSETANTGAREASLDTPPHVPTEIDRWKAEAEADRQKLNTRASAAAKAETIKQFCSYAPDMSACAARIGNAYEFLLHNNFATLTIASRNKAVSLPEMQPAAGMPSYYDVYQVFAFLTRGP